MNEIRCTQGRTWFLTLTLRPEEHFRMATQARHRLAGSGVDFDRLSLDRQFEERHREVNREITLYLKRVRKESGRKFRYFLVAERHRSGLPHYHALVHETALDGPIRAATLKSQWRLGFSQCKLVAETGDGRAASYVAKYLSKDALARVRASAGYGQQHQKTASAILQDASAVSETGHDPQGIDTKPPLTHNPPPNGKEGL